MSSSPLRIGIAGLGTVGAGVVRLLKQNAELLAARAGRPLLVTAVHARDKTKPRPCDLAGLAWVDDLAELPARADVDVVVEAIGGAEGAALALARRTLELGKPYVTANKTLLAAHGTELALAAEAKGLSLGFEAAVAGGIPVIKTLHDALIGNKLFCVQGILNGTCNEILSRMETEGLDFPAALQVAQNLGYAEADPSADIDGFDAAYKVALIAALGFGVRPEFAVASPLVGIRNLTRADLAFAAKLGCRVKLLGVAERRADGFSCRTEPCLVPQSNPLYQIMGVTNAVQIETDALGTLTLIGPGAGGDATASAVLSDLGDLARGVAAKCPFGTPAALLESALPRAEMSASWAVRVTRAGPLDAARAQLESAGLEIKEILTAPAQAPDQVLFILRRASEALLARALTPSRPLPATQGAPMVLRILDEG